MIKDGFIYFAALVFIAAILINLPKIFKGKVAQNIFKFAPPIVLIYLGLMLLCTFKLWDLETTAPAYNALKNPILYAMLFIMLLRCDLRKIIKLGPKNAHRLLFGNVLNRSGLFRGVCHNARSSR